MRTPTFACANCDAPIVDAPVFVLDRAFCCAGCAAGGPCTCSYDLPSVEVAMTTVVESAATVPDRGPAVADRGPATATATAAPPAR